MNKNTADKAAKWWADHLRNGAKLDNGDKSEQGAMTFMLASLVQAQTASEQTDAQIDEFETALSLLLQEMEGMGGRMIVGVDYHPDHTLQKAADNVELPLSMSSLPWKTNMWIEGDVITVSHGYGAPAEELQNA